MSKNILEMLEKAEANDHEPVFMVRAKDTHSVKVLDAYITSMESLDSSLNEQFVNEVKATREAFIEWRKKHIQQVKWPS